MDSPSSRCTLLIHLRPIIRITVGIKVKDLAGVDQNTVASCGRDNVVNVWIGLDKEVTLFGTFKEHARYVNSLAFMSPSDKFPNGISLYWPLNWRSLKAWLLAEVATRASCCMIRLIPLCCSLPWLDMKITFVRSMFLPIIWSLPVLGIGITPFSA